MDVITKTSLSLSPIIDENGNQIASTLSIKLLGVRFSDDMRWNDHIVDVIKKVSKRMYILRNLRIIDNHCPVGIMKMAYVAFIRSVLLYGYPVICNALQYLKDQLIKAEKRAMKMINTKQMPLLMTVADRTRDRLFLLVLKYPSHALRGIFLTR